MSLVGIWAAAIFPNLVPSIGDASGAATKSLAVYEFPAWPSLLRRSSLSPVMLIIAIIGVPIVLFYMYLIYKTFAGKVSADTEGY